MRKNKIVSQEWFFGGNKSSSSENTIYYRGFDEESLYECIDRANNLRNKLSSQPTIQNKRLGRVFVLNNKSVTSSKELVSSILDVVTYLETKVPNEVKSIDEQLYKVSHQLNSEGKEEDVLMGKWFSDIVDKYKPSKELIGVTSNYLPDHDGVLEGCQEIPKLSQCILKYLKSLDKDHKYYDNAGNIVDFKKTYATAFNSEAYPEQTRAMSKNIEYICNDENKMLSYVEKMHFILICALEWMEQSLS